MWASCRPIEIPVESERRRRAARLRRRSGWEFGVADVKTGFFRPRPGGSIPCPANPQLTQWLLSSAPTELEAAPAWFPRLFRTRGHSSQSSFRLGLGPDNLFGSPAERSCFHVYSARAGTSRGPHSDSGSGRIICSDLRRSVPGDQRCRFRPLSFRHGNAR
jgi:hypothetical protein